MHNSFQSYSVETCNVLLTILVEWRAESGYFTPESPVGVAGLESRLGV